MGEPSLDAVVAHARALGLEIDEAPLGGPLNAVLLPEGYVILNCNRTSITKRYALAHECGHWYYGHDWRREHDRPKDERQADRYAAGLLIDPIEYARAERLYGGHPGAIACELGVPRALVTLWGQSVMRSRSL